MYEINADEQERYIAEAQEKYLSTLASVRAEGRDKWIEEGRKEGRAESAETIARLESRIAELEGHSVQKI